MAQPKLPAGVYKRGSSYYGTFTDPQSGRELRRSLGPDLERALALFHHHRDAGTAPVTHVRSVTSIADVLDHYLERQHRQFSDKPRTVENAETSSRVIRRLLGDAVWTPADSFDQNAFWALRDARAASVKSSASVNVTLRYLKAALRLAVRDGLLVGMPCRVELLPPPPDRDRTLTPDQVEDILELARLRDQRAYMIAFLAHRLGLRLSEIINLWWRDAHLDGRRPYLQIEAKPKWSPKTRQCRSLPLDREVVEVLSSWRRALADEGVHLVGPDRYLVPKRDGDPFTRKWASELIGKVFREAGVESGGVHALRHSFVTEALEAGVPVHVVQKMAGHASVQTTLKVYAHVRDDAMREGMEALSRVRSFKQS